MIFPTGTLTITKDSVLSVQCLARKAQLYLLHIKEPVDLCNQSANSR